MFFKRSKKDECIRVGVIFCRRHKDHLMEKAEVLSISPNPYGVDHVRFRVSISSPSRDCFVDERILALNSFTRQYPEMVGA